MEGPGVGVVGTLPNKRLTVRGRRQDYAGNVGVRLAEVTIEVSRTRVESSARVGYVGVDHGLILLGDADALGSWRHFEPLDGLYDVVFWGMVGEAVSGALAAPPLPDGWGWRAVAWSLWGAWWGSGGGGGGPLRHYRMAGAGGISARPRPSSGCKRSDRGSARIRSRAAWRSSCDPTRTSTTSWNKFEPARLKSAP